MASMPPLPSIPPCAGEIISDYGAPFRSIPAVTAQRSTTLLAEIQTLREMGYFEDYRAALAPAGEPLLSAVAGMWTPMEQLDAHYEACTAVGMSGARQVEFGQLSANRCLGTLLGTAVQLARGVGATPWTLLSNLGRFWSRGYIGGGMRVIQLGPKDARVEFAKNPLFRRPFFRNGFRGYAIVLAGLFCSRIVVRDEGMIARDVIAYRGQWA